MKKLTGAQKAAKTRKARKEFADKYGDETNEVVSLLSKGMTTSGVANRLWLPEASVSAYKANLTRGSYNKFLKNCNY